jgi:phosphotransferase family enzyme
MLSAADAALVRLDPILPGLGTVLDPEAFAARLHESLPYLDVESAQMNYLKYNPGSRCVVGYRLQGGQGWDLDTTVTAYRWSDRKPLTDARERVLQAGTRGAGLVVLEDCASVVSVFPRDRKLPALSRLADSGRRERLLAELLPGRPELRNGGVYSLAYKPERRHVALVQGKDGTRVVVKAYTKPQYPEAKALAGVFAGRGKLRVARMLGFSDRHRLLAFEWLPGRTLESAFGGDPLPTGAAAVAGAALAVLHDQNPWRLAARERGKDEARLYATAKVLRYLCPSCGEQAYRLAHHLAERLQGATPSPRALHGNFQARHVLLTDEAVALLDFDRAARGNPASDLGNFLAHLEYMAISGEMPTAAAASLRTALLDGYQTTIRRIAPASIELHTAVNLFYLALQPFRLRAPDWPARIAALLSWCAQLVRWPARSFGTRIDRTNNSDTELVTRLIRQPRGNAST